MNKLLFCKLISNTICIVGLYMCKCNVKCNFYSLSSQILALPMVYSHIFAHLYRQQRFGQNFLLTHIGNRGFKVLSTSRSSKLIWVKSKEVNQAQIPYYKDCLVS